jgi:YesN/AraC family two-component response regulator
MKQRILAVDDEPHMLLLLERIIMEKTPYSIVTTNNPLEVPELLQKEQFDVIITDLKMPGLDGLELLRAIRSGNRFEQVIMITAFGSLESAVEAMSQGVFDYITKPFKKEQIIFTVDRAMRWQRLKRDMIRLEALFALEPYGEAERAFGREYVQRLAARCGGDVAAMSQRSGLPQEALRSSLAQLPPLSGDAGGRPR